MSEVRAPPDGSGIVLAQEKPFRLAQTLVRPASLEVEFQSGTICLEPRVMQVLVALSRDGGEPTSRRRLIECCWGGRRVTDGALNRSIAQLRKALADPGIEISTIPRVGYRLRAVSTPETRRSSAVVAPGISRELPESAGGLPLVAVAAIVTVALLVLVAVVWKWVT